jgi:hypothetical protein
MDPITAVLGIGLPVLLALVTAGTGIGFAMTSSEAVGFLVAKACFAAAAFDVFAFAVYWVVVTRQQTPWNIGIPTILAVIAVTTLVLSLQWLGNREIQLSTWLYPGKEPTPDLPFKADVPKDALRVILGSNLAWTTKMPQVILMMAGDKMIEIDRSPAKNQLVVSTLKIFDDRNNIIARVDAQDGFWVENSTRKKRPDPSTLVVYDHSDVEVLRMIFLNPTTLSLTGTFRHAGILRPVVVTQDYLDVAGGVRMSKSIMGPAGRSMLNVGR